MLGKTQRHGRTRRVTAAALAAAAVLSCAAVAAGTGVALATATNAGSVTFTGTSTGSSATSFTLAVPSGAACTGNSSHDGARVQSFIAPLATDLSTLTFNYLGPTNTGVYPLYSLGTPFINANTGSPLGGVGAGLLTGLPAFTLAPLTSSQLPAGSYKLGFACTTNSGATLDKYWFTYLNLDGSTGYTKPTTPLAAATPVVTNFTGGAVTFTWVAPSNGGLAIDGYQVAYSDNGGSSWSTAVAVSDAASTSHTFTGLTAATSYQFRVAASNALGLGAWASTASTSTAAVSAPSAVTSLVATPDVSGTSISLTWVAPADDGGHVITGYSVWFGSGANWKLASPTGAINSYTITGLAKNTAYTIIVSASNGTYSSPVALAGIGAATTATTAAGAAGKPTLAAAYKKITLKWTAPADNGGVAITAYRVQRSTNGTTWTTITSAASKTTRTLVVSGLTSGTKYYFRVAAITSFGVGAYSSANAAKSL